MNRLCVRVFGGLELSLEGKRVAPVPTQRARGLLAYLALNRGRPLHRDLLCGLLWGELREPDARKSLRTELWRVRSILEPGEADRGRHLRVEGPNVTFRGGEHAWVDAEEFTRCLARVSAGDQGELSPGEAERLGRAVSLYRGDLLEGLYDEWCLVHRERMALGYLAAMERLMEHHRMRGEWTVAIAFGLRVLRRDRLRENVHRSLMLSHLGRGDRPSALRQYEACVRILRAELDIEPMPETRVLRDWIRSGGSALERGSPAADRREEEDPEAPSVAEIDRALDLLESLRRRLVAVRRQMKPPPAALRGGHRRPRARPSSNGANP